MTRKVLIVGFPGVEALDLVGPFEVFTAASLAAAGKEDYRAVLVSIDGQPVPASFDAWCALALPANLAGLPAACVPIGTGRDGLPVGLQVIGPRWSDATVLKVAAATRRLVVRCERVKE